MLTQKAVGKGNTNLPDKLSFLMEGDRIFQFGYLILAIIRFCKYILVF